MSSSCTESTFTYSFQREFSFSTLDLSRIAGSIGISASGSSNRPFIINVRSSISFWQDSRVEQDDVLCSFGRSGNSISPTPCNKLIIQTELPVLLTRKEDSYRFLGK